MTPWRHNDIPCYLWLFSPDIEDLKFVSHIFHVAPQHGTLLSYVRLPVKSWRDAITFFRHFPSWGLFWPHFRQGRINLKFSNFLWFYINNNIIIVPFWFHLTEMYFRLIFWIYIFSISFKLYKKKLRHAWRKWGLLRPQCRNSIAISISFFPKFVLPLRGHITLDSFMRTHFSWSSL